ncbi:MAG: hypothetical protein HY816_06665 [Candidatus Wallbacteria bacterium]|nr:hypothetical protein [Candidatus Wallbacteria bacterium]
MCRVDRARLQEEIRRLNRRMVAASDPQPAAAAGGPVACLSGHMIDRPGRKVPRFPPSSEGSVSRLLDRLLEDAAPEAGCSSAASGADLLFLEALARRGCESHVVLPFSRELFLRTSVEGVEGPPWAARFEEALGRAASIEVINPWVTEPAAEDFDTANLAIVRWSLARAIQSRGSVMPIAVWDGHPGDGAGGTAEFVALWIELGHRVRIVTP